MLTRFKIERYKPYPAGAIDITARRATHCLAPRKQDVERYLANSGAQAWEQYKEVYLTLLAERFAARREAFDAIAEQARREVVSFGCWCPTVKNPDVYRCHTVLALQFMQQKYPDLDVVFPP